MNVGAQPSLAWFLYGVFLVEARCSQYFGGNFFFFKWLMLFFIFQASVFQRICNAFPSLTHIGILCLSSYRSVIKC